MFRSDLERADRVEARLAALEDRLVSHAEELKLNIDNRVMRIQSRVERAMGPFQPGGLDQGAANVLDFRNDDNGSAAQQALHVRNAREALLELNETLRDTRVHLEALSGSIERMKRSISPGR
ncbi:MAG: hypothetical protein KGR69_15260 [Verrucomicrobia bacterium]|nr:hypothetical protein [Verrucomicrobiota bacterium]